MIPEAETAGESPDLTLVVPCYNEAPHLRENVRTLMDVLDNSRFDYDIVLVDDSSQDGTRAVIEQLCQESSRCRSIFHEENLGRGAAFKTGFAASTGRVTGFIDIDLEVAAHYVPPLAALVDQHGYDVATGRRYYLARQTGGLHRIVLSFFYRALCGVLLSLGVEDTETGCKFFKRQTTADAVLGAEANGWFWDTEIMALARLGNLRIREIPVLFLRNHEKASTVRLIPDTLSYIRELYYFRGRSGLSMLGRSPIYWSRRGYDFVMKLLYRNELELVSERIARRIPVEASVTDVCCGTAKLYFDQLENRKAHYLGVDANGHFVMALQRLGVGAKRFDLLQDEVPEADYVVMCSSLYHFRAQEAEVFEKLWRAARCAVIISEPVKNLSTHPFAPVAALASLFSSAGATGDHRFRYDPERFRAFAEAHGASSIELEPGARNGLAVFEKPFSAESRD